MLEDVFTVKHIRVYLLPVVCEGCNLQLTLQIKECNGVSRDTLIMQTIVSTEEDYRYRQHTVLTKHFTTAYACMK